MAGATPGQLFWRVRAPSALRQILLGVNQTTMAAFSMVIIASIIGGTADIGWEVLSTMRKAQFGESLLAGIVIALMAMVMDRITAAAATAEPRDPGAGRNFLARHRTAVVALGLGVGVGALAQVLPVLKEYPESWEIYPARYLNDAVTWLVVEHARTINLIKSWAFFFVMLPVKTGFEQTVTPFTWGFEFTAPLKNGYALLATALVVYTAIRRGVGRASLVAFLAILLFYGITRLPWPALLAMAVLLGWQLGGLRLALGTAAGLGFLVVAGVWPQTMLSVYLCGLAVLLSFAVGIALGILASEYHGVSAFLRPINDTLQTMPLFVILIPFVMIFKIGEFTALLAIMAYAVVPAIRYAEHALRNVPASVVEAATCFGCTRSQLLWRVKLPLAMPVIMLGLNQTIMFGIAMLVIAALVRHQRTRAAGVHRTRQRRFRGRHRRRDRHGLHRDDRRPDDAGHEPRLAETARSGRPVAAEGNRAESRRIPDARRARPRGAGAFGGSDRPRSAGGGHRRDRTPRPRAQRRRDAQLREGARRCERRRPDRGRSPECPSPPRTSTSTSPASPPPGPADSSRAHRRKPPTACWSRAGARPGSSSPPAPTHRSSPPSSCASPSSTAPPPTPGTGPARPAGRAVARRRR